MVWSVKIADNDNRSLMNSREKINSNVLAVNVDIMHFFIYSYAVSQLVAVFILISTEAADFFSFWISIAVNL